MFDWYEPSGERRESRKERDRAIQSDGISRQVTRVQELILVVVYSNANLYKENVPLGVIHKGNQVVFPRNDGYAIEGEKRDGRRSFH